MFSGLMIACIACTILGLGVVVMDLAGALGQPDAAGHDSPAGHGGHGPDAPGLLPDGHGAGQAVSQGDHGPDHPAGGVPVAATAGLPAREGRGQGLFRLYSAARNLVYFCLGFGATGIFALATGLGDLAAALWAGAAGALVMFLIRGIRSLTNRELDSSIKDHEFLMDEARVVVPVLPGRIGKAVVLRYGKETEVYVRFADPGVSAAKDETVRIVDVAGDCFAVEKEPAGPDQPVGWTDQPE